MDTPVLIIPCLDVDHGRVVKGVHFVNLRDAGDPAELARHYQAEGADELTVLDISATTDGRDTALEMVARTARTLTIPLTVGGGIRGIADADAVLGAGADRISVNSAAVADPSLIDALTGRFGPDRVTVAVDVRGDDPPRATIPSGYEVTVHGGTRGTGLDAVEWARQAADRGAGRVLLTTMDADGTTAGFDLDILAAVAAAVPVPVIASGGAGTVEHFVDAARAGAAAVLAASVFHFGTVSIPGVRAALAAAGFAVSGGGAAV